MMAELRGLRQLDGEGRSWLEANRCPHCVNEGNCMGNYKVFELHGGWRCYGYRSKHWDERMWEKVAL